MLRMSKDVKRLDEGQRLDTKRKGREGIKLESVLVRILKLILYGEKRRRMF